MLSFRHVLPALLLTALAAASCSPPPASSMTGSTRGAEGLDLGVNSAGETCALQRGTIEARIFCGGYAEPSGRVVTAAAADPIAWLKTSPWRVAFNGRFECGEPSRTAMLDTDAASMSCVHRTRGYRQSVIAARLGGNLYVADSIEPAAATLTRAIEVMTNRRPAVTVATDPAVLGQRRRAADQTVLTGAEALAAMRQFEQDGSRENREDNYAASEAAYRRVVEIQKKLAGADSPSLAVPLAKLAIQVSNQRRFAESEQLLANANKLAALPGQLSPITVPLTQHLTALDRINRGLNAEALGLLERAENGFTRLLPAGALEARQRGGGGSSGAARRLADSATDTAAYLDPTVKEAMKGLIETRRYRAVVLRNLGREAEARALLEQSRPLFADRDPRLGARYYRTVGMTEIAAGRANTGLPDLGQSVSLFIQGNASRPLLETEFLLVDELLGRGEIRAAASRCREVLGVLEKQNVGAQSKTTSTTANKVMPCLRAFHTEASRWGGVLSERSVRDMFALAQLAQGNLTSRQIAVATAALQEGGNPEIRKAMQQQDTLKSELDGLYRKREEMRAEAGGSAGLGSIEEKIRRAEDERRDAGITLQAVAPRLTGLLRQSVSLDQVRAVLRPREALAIIVLGDQEGYVILARANAVYEGRIEGGAARVDALVRRFRDSTELRSGKIPPAFDTEAARELYDTVLKPVERGYTDATRLVVAPTGSLLSIPFGALLTGPVGSTLENAPFLIRRFEVGHVPAARNLVDLRNQTALSGKASRPWFGFGEFIPATVAQATATFPPSACQDSNRRFAALPLLKGSVDELNQARGQLGATPQEELLARAFTADTVKDFGGRGGLRQYNILHFATHALLPGELNCQTEPAIVTSTPAGARDASGALLKSSEIQGMNLNADLVILSACNTGGSDTAGAGESLSGLASSFFFANARALLVTHWAANDKAMQELITKMLISARDVTGGDYTAALALTQRNLLDLASGQDAILAHPYFWAVGAIVGGGG